MEPSVRIPGSMTRRNVAESPVYPIRSWLFVPGNRDRMIAKSGSVGADVVIFDLEDSVSPDDKAIAREKIGRHLAMPTTKNERPGHRPKSFVRINHAEGDDLVKELQSVVSRGLAGVCVPKVESVAQVTTISKILGKIELEAPLLVGSIRLLLLIETARGLLHAEQIAAGDGRVMALAFGAEDFALDMGIDRLQSSAELDRARWHVSVSARAAGVFAIDCVFPWPDDESGLASETISGKQMGYLGKQLIHPRQIETVHAAFSPTREEIDNARRIVEAFKEARSQGKGVTVLDGRMIDKPVADRAGSLLDHSKRYTDATI